MLGHRPSLRPGGAVGRSVFFRPTRTHARTCCCWLPLNRFCCFLCRGEPWTKKDIIDEVILLTGVEKVTKHQWQTIKEQLHLKPYKPQVKNAARLATLSNIDDLHAVVEQVHDFMEANDMCCSDR